MAATSDHLGRSISSLNIYSGLSIGALFAQTFALQLDAVGVVHQAIEDGMM
jgi:hypothetical protein